LLCDLSFPSPTIAKFECFFDPNKINLENGVKFTTKIKGCSLKSQLAKQKTDGTFKLKTDGTLKLKTSVETISILSDVVDFNTTPMNSIIYRCNGNFIGACYGTNQTTMNNFISMVNSIPPVQPNSCFLQYGNYFDNGDDRVRLEMPVTIANSFCLNGTISIEIIYD
jgi:hypothetical protein